MEDVVVAVLVEDGYEDLEFWYPVKRLEEAGATVDIVAPDERTYHSKHGYAAEPDRMTGELRSRDYDGMIVPGGRECPDRLRTNKRVLRFVRRMYEEEKPVAAICHAGWVLASADILSGHTVTCYPSIKDDVINAGATYTDRETVVSDNIVTARNPDDLPTFMAAFLDMFYSGDA